MGNTGSIQDLHPDRAISDLQSFYRSRKQPDNVSLILPHRPGDVHSTEWTKSFPRPKLSSTDKVSPTPNFKVLPNLNENPRLRSTANGAILQSGGTISGRREQIQTMPTAPRIQRSRTLIYDKGDESKTNIGSKSIIAQPTFRRAQTQLQFSYDERPKPEEVGRALSADHGHPHTGDAKGIEVMAASTVMHTKDIGFSRSEPSLAQKDEASVVRGSAIDAQRDMSGRKDETRNKYKKRRAPAVPSCNINGTASRGDNNINNKNNNNQNISPMQSAAKTATLAKEAKETLVKTRLFRTKAQTESTQVRQKKQSTPTLQLKPPPKLQHPLKSLQPKQPQEYPLEMRRLEPLKLPYRREQSFDASLLRQLEQNINPNYRAPTTVTLQRQNKKIDIMQLMNNYKNKPVTKIPQLKKTFYFGMEKRRNKPKHLPGAPGVSKFTQPLIESVKHLGEVRPNINVSKHTTSNRSPFAATDKETSGTAARNEARDGIEVSSPFLTPFYDIGIGYRECATTEEEEAGTSGLQVHVRPTLPRRQLDIPRFNPANAWRMLTEEQQNLKFQRKAVKLVPAASRYNSKTSEPAFRTNVKLISRQEQKEEEKEAITASVDCEIDGGAISNCETKEAPIQPIRRSPLGLGTIDDRVLRQPQAKKSSKVYLTPWTPQQDLEDEEDDNSSDEFHTSKNHDSEGNLTAVNTKSTGTGGHHKTQGVGVGGGASVHVFSLSLPRDGQLPIGHDNKGVSDKKQSFCSLQKLKRTVSSGNCGCMQSKYNDEIVDHHQMITPAGANSYGNCASAVTTNGAEAYGRGGHEIFCSNNYRSDNWVLASGSRTLGDYPAPFENNRWETSASGTIEPISLSYLTGGKHVMYLPNETTDPVSTNVITPKGIAPIAFKKTSACERESDARVNLQDSPATGSPSAISWGSGRMANEKPQRFSFQSTVRLIEKRRLAEKLSKETEIKEAQRHTELEAMKRVEEDFQRKRAFEKATIRHQLRLVSSSLEDMEQYQSLPGRQVEEKCDAGPHSRQRVRKCDEGDANNNIHNRADPDGAVSSPSSSPILQDANTDHLIFRKPSNHFEFNLRGSDIDVDMDAFQRTASLVEPYLQSIVW